MSAPGPLSRPCGKGERGPRASVHQHPMGGPRFTLWHEGTRDEGPIISTRKELNPCHMRSRSMPGRTGIRVLEGTIDERQRTDAVTIHFKDAPTHARPATQMNSGDSNQEQVATLSLRRSLIPLASIGVVIAGMVGLFAYAGGWLSPHILSPAPMIDTFQKVNGLYPGFRRNHAKGVCVTGYFESNGRGVELSRAAVFPAGIQLTEFSLELRRAACTTTIRVGTLPCLLHRAPRDRRHEGTPRSRGWPTLPRSG